MKSRYERRRFETAFRRKSTGEVVVTGPVHDVMRALCLLRGADVYRLSVSARSRLYGAFARAHDAGFVDQDGRFYTREEVSRLLGYTGVRGGDSDVLRGKGLMVPLPKEDEDEEETP